MAASVKDNLATLLVTTVVKRKRLNGRDTISVVAINKNNCNVHAKDYNSPDTHKQYTGNTD